MTQLDKDQVIAKFEAAYEAANGKKPTIEAKSGWYSVDGGKNIRLAQLDELANELNSGSASKAAPKAASTKSAAKPAEKKASAPAAKKASKKSSKGFSVKAYWKKLLGDKDHDCTTPR